MAGQTQLPGQFSDLQELADSFAISDDVKRGQLVAEASQSELKRLVSNVWPRLPEINAYLDRHDDEAACLLGSLAEVACEVQLDIGS